MAITIVGTGHHVPGKPVPNAALARVMDTNDEWIRQRTGIEQRHFAAEGEGVSDLASIAAQKAIEAAGIAAEEIDYIIFATMTPEHFFPGSGGLLGAKLGIGRVPALDIRQQCAAMPFGLQVANGLVESNAASTVLLVGADSHAGMMPWTDWDILLGETDRKVTPDAYARATKHRGIGVLFGDGAAAMVLRKAPAGRGFLGAEVHTDGRMYNRIFIPAGWKRRPYLSPGIVAEEAHIPHMQGQDLMKTAVLELGKVVRSLCAKHGVTLEDVDMFLAHQANDRINGAVRQALGIPASKVPSNIARYGNTSAATIGLLMDEQIREGKLREGQLVCLFGLGAGLNWGAALVRM